MKATWTSPDQGSDVFAALDDRTYEIDLQRSSRRCLIADDGGRVFDCRVDGPIESGLPVDVSVGTQSYAITLADPRRLQVQPLPARSPVELPGLRPHAR
jgi:hypothetical protein